MACSCLPTNIVIPPPTPSCPNCLRAGSAIISCLNSVPACEAGEIDVSEIGNYDNCETTITYSIVSFDTGFDTVTISSTGLIEFSFLESAIPGTFPEIRFLVTCEDSIFSSVGRVKVCVRPICSGVDCEVDEVCNPCTGECEPVEPIINGGVD